MIFIRNEKKQRPDPEQHKVARDAFRCLAGYLESRIDCGKDRLEMADHSRFSHQPEKC